MTQRVLVLLLLFSMTRLLVASSFTDRRQALDRCLHSCASFSSLEKSPYYNNYHYYCGCCVAAHTLSICFNADERESVPRISIVLPDGEPNQK